MFSGQQGNLMSLHQVKFLNSRDNRVIRKRNIPGSLPFKVRSGFTSVQTKISWCKEYKDFFYCMSLLMPIKSIQNVLYNNGLILNKIKSTFFLRILLQLESVPYSCSRFSGLPFCYLFYLTYKYTVKMLRVLVINSIILLPRRILYHKFSLIVIKKL